MFVAGPEGVRYAPAAVGDRRSCRWPRLSAAKGEDLPEEASAACGGLAVLEAADVPIDRVGGVRVVRRWRCERCGCCDSAEEGPC